MSEELWQRRLGRERDARKQAEQLLERKSLELFKLNQELQHVNQNLEKLVQERTAALEAANARLQREVHERQRIEHALRAGAVELQAMNADLEEFAYLVSHDLQEPLRKVNTFAQMLSEVAAGKLPPEGSDYLQRLSASAVRIHQMVRDLLQISRVSNRQVPRSNVLPDVLLRRVLDDLETALKEADAGISTTALPPLHASPVQLEQLFRNLLSNSVKYREPSRRLEIQVAAGAVRDGMVEITLQDNGQGFDQRHAELIFKPFQRLHASPQYPGTGIGLAICRKIVERHGGRISAQGMPGKGATFRLTLPVARDNS